jgi:hypothetical protein
MHRVSEANIPRISLEGHKQPKVPTLICYDPNDKTKFSWGSQVGWKNESIQGVKLLLIPTGNIKSDLKKFPNPPVEVAADFIGAIYAHALSIIETRYQKTTSSSARNDLCSLFRQSGQIKPKTLPSGYGF